MPKVEVHSHPKLGTFLSGQQELAATHPEELLEHLRYGASLRSVSATAMNAQSSRGHSIFTVKCEQEDSSFATLYIVDLAGHENEKTTKATGERLKELSFINTTLFHLREVISSLSEK